MRQAQELDPSSSVEHYCLTFLVQFMDKQPEPMSVLGNEESKKFSPVAGVLDMHRFCARIPLPRNSRFLNQNA